MDGFRVPFKVFRIPRECRPRVYVDVSLRNGFYAIGFVCIRDGITSAFATEKRRVERSYAKYGELHAIQLACRLWPGWRIFCDDRNACDYSVAEYVERWQNPAHMIARNRRNFISRTWIEAQPAPSGMLA